MVRFLHASVIGYQQMPISQGRPEPKADVRTAASAALDYKIPLSPSTI